MKLEKSRVSLEPLGMGVIIITTALACASSVNAATANISASATIVPPVTISERSDIRFASFVAGVTPRTITLLVPPSLPQVPLSSATLIENGMGAVHISGPPSDTFSVSTPTTTMLASGDNTITLERIKLRYGPTGTAGAVSGPGVLSPTGEGTIVIGGALNVAAGQAVGTYTGSLAVSVDY